IGGLLANVSDASAVSRSANRRGSVESMILKTSVGVTMLLVVMDAPGFVDPSEKRRGRSVRCRRGWSRCSSEVYCAAVSLAEQRGDQRCLGVPMAALYARLGLRVYTLIRSVQPRCR